MKIDEIIFEMTRVIEVGPSKLRVPVTFEVMYDPGEADFRGHVISGAAVAVCEDAVYREDGLLMHDGVIEALRAYADSKEGDDSLFKEADNLYLGLLGRQGEVR